MCRHPALYVPGDRTGPDRTGGGSTKTSITLRFHVGSQTRKKLLFSTWTYELMKNIPYPFKLDLVSSLILTFYSSMQTEYEHRVGRVCTLNVGSQTRKKLLFSTWTYELMKNIPYPFKLDLVSSLILTFHSSMQTEYEHRVGRVCNLNAGW